jgi:hypothetical protein
VHVSLAGAWGGSMQIVKLFASGIGHAFLKVTQKFIVENFFGYHGTCY